MSSSNIEIQGRQSFERERIVSCIGFHAARGDSALAGYADLHLGAPYRLRLLSCPCFVNDGVMSVSLPTRPYQDDAGRQKYAPMVAFDDQAMLARFAEESAAVVLAYVPSILGRSS